MNRLKKSWRLAAALVLAAGAAGCDSGQPQGWGVRSIEWSHFAAGEPEKPGIDQASVRLGSYGKGTALVVWSDGRGGTIGSNYDRQRGGVHYAGEILADDGRRIAIDCLATDLAKGTATIDRQKFDLASGRVLLVKTSGGGLVVEQLARDPDTLPQEVEALRKFAARDAEIQAFFKGGAAASGADAEATPADGEPAAASPDAQE
jgi:hypothetical protein